MLYQDTRQFAGLVQIGAMRGGDGGLGGHAY